MEKEDKKIRYYIYFLVIAVFISLFVWFIGWIPYPDFIPIPGIQKEKPKPQWLEDNGKG